MKALVVLKAIGIGFGSVGLGFVLLQCVVEALKWSVRRIGSDATFGLTVLALLATVVSFVAYKFLTAPRID